MSHRLHPCKTDFVGRTIKRVDSGACNIWRFEFEDGGIVAIEVDALGHGLYGLTICDECGRASRENTHTMQRMRMEKSSEKVA